MLRCPSRPGIGGGVPKGWRQPVGAQLISFQSPRTPLSSGGTLSALASPKWGKEAEQPPHSPESSTASLGLAFTTYVLCVDRFSLAGGHASCGEKKSALDSVLWHDMPGGGPGADSQDAGRRAIRRARLSLRFQWLQRKPISPARDNSGDPNASQEKKPWCHSEWSRQAWHRPVLSITALQRRYTNISVWECFHWPLLQSSRLMERSLQHTKDKLLQLEEAVHRDTCINVFQMSGAPLSLWQLIGCLSSTESVRPA
jgi:hypothetical protein